MIKAIKSYETSDGEVFTSREDAERHEAIVAVDAWVAGAKFVPVQVMSDHLVDLIGEDPDKARAVLLPLMPVKRPRASKAKPKKKATVAEYESLLGDAA